VSYPGRADDFAVLLFSGHALHRMLARGIDEDEVRRVLDAEDAIEIYPEHTPYPSALYLGLVAGRALHVVAARDEAGSRVIVITVYEPDTALWDATFRRRVSP
jgi:hypothetical protein